MSRVAPLVAAAASTPDVRFGFFLCGAGKPRRGWFRVGPLGPSEFLGRSLEDVRKRAARRAAINAATDRLAAAYEAAGEGGSRMTCPEIREAEARLAALV